MRKDRIIGEIEKLLKFKSENEILEIKNARGGLSKIYDTVSAFANTRGGLIIFGIDEKNDFKITGTENLNELQNKISELCSQKMFPPVRPVITQLEYNDKNLLAVEIPELSQREKPCYYIKEGINKGSYIRVGDNDRRMTESEIYSFQSYKNGKNEDLRIVERAKFEDLDIDKINEYIRNIKKEKPKFSKKDRKGILKISNIIKENEKGEIHPTLSGIMIFGEYPQQFFPQLFIACSVIPGIEMGELGSDNQRFDDNARIEGNIEEMLEETLNFLEKNMRIKVIIDEKGKRKNIPEYPIKALREAIVNALVHRDYSVFSEKMYIKVFKYKNRIEIENPGGLYGANRIEQLGTDTMLEVRNSSIIQILENEKNILENRHSGIPTMKSEMAKMNLPEPEFISTRGTFKVVFYGSEDSQIIEKSEQENAKSDKDKDKVKSDKDKVKSDKDKVKSDKDKVKSDKDKVKSNQEKVLEYCIEPKSKREIMEYLKIKSQSYVSSKILKPLIDENKLRFTIQKKYSKNQKYIRVGIGKEGVV